MVSVSSSFSGLSAANITTLFGTAASSSDPTAKDGATSSTGGTSGTPITGADTGSNAAKAIQAIVTQIQVEKMQTSSQGKVSTASLVSASVSATYDKSFYVESNGKTINVPVTAISGVATATADNAADAAGMLLSQVHAQEAQVEATQGGALMTADETHFGAGQTSNLVTWTANSVTVDTEGVANQGVELYEEEGALNAPSYFSSLAQKFEAPSPISTSASTMTPAGADNDDTSASNSGGNGSALYLEVSIDDGWIDDGYNKFAALEQQIVSAFQNGTLTGQNGTAAKDGDGFSSSLANDDGSVYNIGGTIISNYDQTAVANKAIKTPVAQVFQNETMGGTVVSDQWDGSDGWETMAIIIPQKSS